MIKLVKLPQPEILARKREEWTRDLLAAIEAGDIFRARTLSKRYNHPDVKEALKRETRGKCAYCEAKVSDVAHGDIEHITPKSICVERTFEWENLTFSCQVCNVHKSDKEILVDPYVDDPDSHFAFIGPFAKGRSAEGASHCNGIEIE